MLYKTARKWTTPLALLATLPMMTRCAAGTVPTDGCAGWEPIRPSAHDILTPETTREILTHDQHGAIACGWKR
jgi:hypothetical protein